MVQNLNDPNHVLATLPQCHDFLGHSRILNILKSQSTSNAVNFSKEKKMELKKKNQGRGGIDKTNENQIRSRTATIELKFFANS